MHKVIIIGSGPAGLTAAIYAARANLEPIVFEGGFTEAGELMQPGGQLMITTEVENYPGFPEGITGPELVDKMRDQAKRFGSVHRDELVDEVDFSGFPHRLRVGTEWFESATVIISTGANATWLGLPSEKQYQNRGVSACATCDGAFFRDQEIAIVGGGDTALEEALFLTRFATKVYLIHRRDELRASKIMQERALAHAKIFPVWNSTVDEVLGDGNRVTGLRLRSTVDGTTSELACTGMFVAIGHKPNTDLFVGKLDLHDNGYIRNHGRVGTSVPGVFAAGDVADFRYRQAITAAGMGCMAAIDAERLVEHYTGEGKLA